MQPDQAQTSGLGVPVLPPARWVGLVAPVCPTHGMLVLSCPSAALRVCGVLAHLAPVQRCARSVRCVASAVSLATWLLFTGAPAWFVVLGPRCPGPLCSRSLVRPLGVLCCVWGFLGHLAPVHQCARWVCCFACAVSWATWLLFTGVHTRCVAFGVRCPGSLGSCSPVCPLCVLCCVCGVLGHLAPVHRCACSLCCFARAVSLATGLLFTGVPALSFFLLVRCPRPLSSCSPVCPLGLLLCVCGVMGSLAPIHRCARPWCPVPLLPSVHMCVPCPCPRGVCSPVCALCAVCVCRWWLCPSSSPPNFLFSFFLFLLFVVPLLLFSFSMQKRGLAYTAGTGMGNWCSSAIVLCSLACVIGALVAVAPQGCGSRVLMYTGTGQGGFGCLPLCFWCWLVRRLCGLLVWAVAALLSRRAWLGVKG